jgi:hypothetical protein
MDSSVVCEPGATGSSWRLHYAIELSSLCGEEAHVTEISEGESLGHFAVKAGDIVMAVRGLATRRGIRHVVSHGGEVLVRLNLTRVPLEDESGRPVPLLRTLAVGQTGHWLAWIRDEHGVIPVRVCAVKKRQAQTRQTQYKMRKKAQRRLRPNTLEAAHYGIILTTLLEPAAATLLERYRCRWQIERAFKRLKSLLQLGHLKKYDPQSAQAWLQGKLLVASLIETLIAIGEHFSPWGDGLARLDHAPLSLA